MMEDPRNASEVTAAPSNQPSVAQAPPLLLQLPPELQLYLSRFLDLGSLIVYARATCKPLRQLFGNCDRLSLYLFPSHRLSLAEWMLAALHLGERGLTKSRLAEKMEMQDRFKGWLDSDKPQRYIVQAALAYDESQDDFDLLLRILSFLGGPEQSPGTSAAPIAAAGRDPGASAVGRPTIRSLSLVCWHGVAAKDLIHLLRTHPMLANLRLVIKTERLEGRAWREATMGNVATDPSPPGAPEQLSIRPKVDRISQRRSSMMLGHGQGEGSDRFAYDRCTTTQTILQVGKRRASRPGEKLLKGEGLQIGFEGLCLEEAAMYGGDGGHVEGDHAAGAEAKGQGTRAKPPVDDPEASAQPSRLHVIFQGRYQDASEDSLEVDELFSRSIITCNHCKERLEA